MRNYKELLKNIRTLIFDYDGVFTDGIVIVTDEGELIRTANTKDGYAVQQAVKKGFHVAVITGGKNGSVKTRMNMLGVKHVYTHVENKAEKMMEVLAETDTKPEQVMYMGDDIPDMGPMKKVA
ncbi:MAG: KdsC family phosphatase, partial [Bacteroidota bacterium]